MPKQFKTHTDFFDKYGDSFVIVRSISGFTNPILIEEMYQQFKARFMEEVERMRQGEHDQACV